MVTLADIYAETILEMCYSYRRIVKECESDLTTQQTEALDELKYECSSAKKAVLRQGRAA
jgi:vacuolar-type H+-ATPase subunit H